MLYPHCLFSAFSVLPAKALPVLNRRSAAGPRAYGQPNQRDGTLGRPDSGRSSLWCRGGCGQVLEFLPTYKFDPGTDRYGTAPLLGRICLDKGVKEDRHSMVKPCADFSVKSAQAPRPCAGRPLSRQFRGGIRPSGIVQLSHSHHDGITRGPPHFPPPYLTRRGASHSQQPLPFRHVDHRSRHRQLPS